ncbi:MAG: amidohydrolase [Acidimicrobiia bacterium]
MHADLVIRAARVFTADPERMFAEAVAVTGDRIAAVGTADEIDSLVGRETEVLETGGLVTPGFIDAHVHPATSGLDRLRISFENCSDAQDAVSVIAAYAASHPDQEWLIGAGWLQSWFEHGCPSKELIDQVVSDRPVLVTNADGHGAWANSVALRRSGVTASTADPVDGRIERLPDGSPQGTLHEGAVALVEAVSPDDTGEDLAAGLVRGQEELLRYGITGWQDAAVTEEVEEAYLRLAKAGDLVGRVVGSLWWDRHRGLEQVEELIQRREHNVPGFSSTTVKLMLDGVAENFTAAMLDPYLDGSGSTTDEIGIDLIEPTLLKEAVAALDARGFQCHFHAIGDRAVRNALDAVEHATAVNGPSDHRHHIAHLQVVHPDDIQRFARLGVVANAQALWAQNDDYQIDLTQPFFGPVRSSWQYPYGDLLRAGARLAMGSDWGVTTADVMQQIHVAVHRALEEDIAPLGPDNALTPVQALTAFTAGSAYVNHVDGESGTLAPGMLADLAVLDADPSREGSFRDTKVTSTLVGGRVVWRSDG